MNDLMELKGRLMAQAALLPGKPANNYMVAIEFDGERQVNVVPVSGCEDGCTAAIKVAIEYLHSFGHTGMATDALVCGTGFWYRPPEQLIRQMQGERPILVTHARNGLGRAFGTPNAGADSQGSGNGGARRQTLSALNRKRVK